MVLAGFATVLCQTCASYGGEVFDNIRWLEVVFENVPGGKHTLSLVMIDPEIVVERIVVNPDYNICSCFGPPPKLSAEYGPYFGYTPFGECGCGRKIVEYRQTNTKEGLCHES